MNINTTNSIRYTAVHADIVFSMFQSIAVGRNRFSMLREVVSRAGIILWYGSPHSFK